MPKIKVLCPSRPKEPYRAMLAELAARSGVEIVFTKAIDPRALKGTVVLLDQSGRELDTKGFSEFVRQKLEAGSLVFVVGGPDGIQIKHDFKLSLGKLLLNHQLALAVLLDQLFRALNPQHPYNRH